MSSHFLTVNWFYFDVVHLLSSVYPSFPQYKPIVCVDCMIMKGGAGVGAKPGGRWKSFLRVYTKLFWRAIYCANPRPKNNFRSGTLSPRVLGRLSPRIICEYNIATAIVIQPLIHPHMYKMGSYIFSAMSWLKSKSTTRAFFPSMT